MANSVINQIAAFFLGHGLTREQVAGILGNLDVESGFRTDAYNQGEQAIGLAQWRLGRRTALQAYAAKRGRTETDLQTQLEFLWAELTGSHSTALTKLAQATTPAAAAAAFDQYYEISSGDARNARIAKAEQYYPKVGPGAGDNGYKYDPATGYGAVGMTDSPGQFTPPDAWTGTATGTEAGYVTGNPAASLFSLPKTLLYMSIFAVAGVAIIVGGLIVTAKPATDKVKDTALTVIDTAKTVKP